MRKFANKNYSKSPNLVTLPAKQSMLRLQRQFPSGLNPSDGKNKIKAQNRRKNKKHIKAYYFNKSI